MKMRDIMRIIEGESVQPLTELFNSAETTQALRQDGADWTATWGDGKQSFQIYFEPDVNFPGAYSVSFAPVNVPSDFNHTRDMLARKDSTGRSKNATDIFGQVIGYIRQFLTHQRPSGLIFVALEAKRLALYKRMLRYLDTDIKQGGYLPIVPDSLSIGIIRKQSRLYVQYQSGRLAAKVGDLQSRKHDWMDRKLQR